MTEFFKRCGLKEYVFFSILAIMFVGGIIGLASQDPDPAMQPDSVATSAR